MEAWNMKKNTVFEGNLRDGNVVQKSEPLLLMRSVPFELGELKVLDTYLSRINSHEPTSITVTFTKAEYEELMGLNNVDMRTLRKYTKSMLQKVVDLPMSDGYVQFTLFTCAACKKDEYGRQVIALSCSEQAKQVFFNIEKLGYLQYELKNILTLTSKYSYLLYLYLRKERYRGVWEIDLQELREHRLDLKDNEYYSNYKYFKRDILDKAIKEINKKTDIEFKYEAVKKGRCVVAIRFLLQKKESEQIKGQMDIYDYPEVVEGTYSGSEFDDFSKTPAWIEALEELNFTLEQVQELRNLIATIPEQVLPELQFACEDIDLRRYHYISLKISIMNRRDSESKIKNKFAYLKKMVEKDIEKEKG